MTQLTPCPICAGPLLPDGFCPACAVRERGGDSAEDALVAEALNGPWEPAPIAKCFATPRPAALPFIIQMWFDLEALRSPLLLGEFPADADDAEATCMAFGLAKVPEDGAAVAHLFAAMIEAIEQRFAMALRMVPEGEARTLPDQGFGRALPLLSDLMRLAGVTSLREALATDVGQAYALVAAARNGEGWRAVGTPYNLRELGDSKEQAPEIKPEGAPAEMESSLHSQAQGGPA
jgi:hypothetical protein